MTTLALEFSSTRRSAAVAVADGTPFEAVHPAGRVTAPWRLVAEALERAGARREDIGEIVIGLGPGSYTGIRTALAMAEGWALARPVRLVGVNSALAAAEAWRQAGGRGRVAVAVDAQRGEFYFGNWLAEDAGLRELAALRILTAGRLPEAAGRAAVIISPDASARALGVAEVFPRAGDLIRLAATHGSEAAPGGLEPVYLRPVAFTRAPPTTLRWAAEASRAIAGASGESA